MSTKHRNFIDHQLLVDIFGFLPNYITDDLYDAMNICLYNVTEGFTKRFIALYPEKGTLISEAIRNFEREMEEELDNSFNLFQEYVFNNILRVPEKLDIQPLYLQDIPVNLSKEHEEILDVYLNKTRQDIITQRRLAQFLKEKIRHLEHELETIDEHCQIIIEIPKKHKVIDVEFTMQTVKNNLDQLKTMIMQNVVNLKEGTLHIGPDKRTLDIRAQINAALRQRQD